MYLLSRSELFRLIGLDTDKRFLVLGPDDNFREWIDVGIGRNTTISDVPPKSGAYDVILCVSELDDENKALLKGLLARGGTVWELRRGEGTMKGTWRPFDTERVIVRTV